MKHLLFAAAVLLCACGALKRKSEISYEKGKVVAMTYAAPLDGSGTTTTFNSEGGIGIGSTSIHTDEKYMVVLRCEHGIVFSVDNKSLWAKLNEGDSVVIEYYELVNSKGQVKDLDFVDANKLQVEQ